IQTQWGCRLRDMQIDDARLHDGKAILHIDGENPIHLLQLDDDSTFRSHRTAAQSRSCTARQKWKSIFAGNFYYSGNLFGGLRKDHRIRFALEYRKRVAFLDQKLG